MLNTDSIQTKPSTALYETDSGGGVPAVLVSARAGGTVSV